MLAFPSGNLNPQGAVLHGSSLPRSGPFPLGRRGISPDFPDFPAEPIRPGPKARPPRFVSVQLRADKTSSPRSPGAARRAIKGARGATLAAPRRSDCGSPLSSELSPFSLSLVHVCSLAVLIFVLVCVPVFCLLSPIGPSLAHSGKPQWTKEALAGLELGSYPALSAPPPLHQAFPASLSSSAVPSLLPLIKPGN